MDAQSLAVAVLVGTSFVYTAQALLPATWRVRILYAMALWPLPRLAAAALAHQAEMAASSGCNGCARANNTRKGASSASPPKEEKIVFMPRRGP